MGGSSLYMLINRLSYYADAETYSYQTDKRSNCVLLFVLAICKKKYCVFNVRNVGGVFNNLDKKNLAKGGY